MPSPLPALWATRGVPAKFEGRAGIDLRRPAQQGDVEAAVSDGAVAIGLVDGHYQQVGAVWHKEILLALSMGVRVFGAASMGALRAAECAAFGMIPVGGIANGYCSGELFDDADVAVTNGPLELGYPPLTEPMVTVAATLTDLAARDLLGPEESRSILAAAQSIYFADRTIEAMRYVEQGRVKAGKVVVSLVSAAD